MKKIAILNLTRMGDLIMTGPMVQSIRDKNPDAEIHFIVVDKFSDVAEGLGCDKVIGIDFNLLTTLATRAVDSEKIFGTLDYYRNTLGQLKKESYDEIHNITHTIISALLVSQMHGKVVSGITLDKTGYRRIENKWGRYFFAGNLNRGLNPYHLSDVQLGITDGIGGGYKPTFKISESGKESADTLIREVGLDKSNKWIGIQCGASDKGKRWDTEAFASTARLIQKENKVQFLLFGTGNESDITNEVAANIGPNAFNLAGKTDIPTLAALLEKCDLLISNDTGTMHLASAVRTRTIVLTLGNALSDETAPYGDGHYILEPTIDCFPCSFRTKCPHFNCHRQIQPGDVALIAESVLKGVEPDIAALSSTVNVFKTDFDGNGLFHKEELTVRELNLEQIVRRIYRSILFEDMTGKKYSETVYQTSQSYNVTSHEINNLIQSAQNMLDKLIRGEDVSSKLLDIINGKGNGHDPVRLTEEIENIYNDIYDGNLKVEHLRPILLLLRFDQENIPVEGAIEQVEATKDSFIRTKGLVEELIRLLPEPSSVKEFGDRLVAEPVKRQTQTNDPFRSFIRARFNNEHLTVILAASHYFVQNEIARSLKRMGHKVIPLVFKNNPNVVQQLLEYSLEADLFITVNHLAFDKNGELEHILNKINMPYVSWFVDRPGFILLDYQVQENQFGHIYTWERSTINEIKRYGYEKVSYLPLACDDSLFHQDNLENTSDRLIWVADSNVLPAGKWYKKAGVDEKTARLFNQALVNQLKQRIDPVDNVLSTAKELKLDTSDWSKEKLLNFASAVALKATSDNRIDMANKLNGLNLEIYGDSAWNDTDIKAELFGRVSYEEELPTLYKKGIHLNSTSFQMPTAVNQRVFDVPMSGGILITDAQDDMISLFDKDEFIGYENIVEVPDLVNFIRNNRSEAIKKMNKAAERITAEHTYIHRLQKIITEIADKFRLKSLSV